MIYADAHIHVTQIQNWMPIIDEKQTSPVCACAHSPSEWNELGKLSENNTHIVTSFGIHPQNPDIAYIEKLEQLAKSKTCNCIGEAGFDLYTPEYKKTVHQQTEVWNAQLELCITYKLPLIIHCRKAIDKIFSDSQKLSKLPSVIFHSFPGSPIEAQSFLKRGVNAFFSLGKPLLNNNKRAIACAQELSSEHLLVETDAPFQTLKGESQTPASDIITVYKEVARLRNTSLRVVTHEIYNNFSKAFHFQ